MSRDQGTRAVNERRGGEETKKEDEEEKKKETGRLHPPDQNANAKKPKSPSQVSGPLVNQPVKPQTRASPVREPPSQAMAVSLSCAELTHEAAARADLLARQAELLFLGLNRAGPLLFDPSIASTSFFFFL